MSMMETNRPDNAGGAAKPDRPAKMLLPALLADLLATIGDSDGRQWG